MATSALASRLSYFSETTAGTPPANAAAWASETSIRHIAGTLDVTALAQSVVEDERSQTYILDDEPVIKGIRGGVSFPFEAYLHGHGDSPGDGSAVAANDLSTILLNGLGGRELVTSDNLVAGGAHSTTQIELTDTLNVGDWVSLADSDSNMHLRRVTSVAAGGVGQIHTLHRALPFTPSDGETARGCIVLYIDEDALEDSAGASGRTLSWLIEKGRGSQRESWECRACKSNLTGITLDRNGAPKVQFENLVGSFVGPESAPVPTWSSTPTGSAGLVVGPDTTVFWQAQGTTTENTLQVAGFTVEPGVVSQPIETQTEDATNMPGLYGYTLARNPCRVSMDVVPFNGNLYAQFTAETVYHIQFERSAALGSAWSIYFPDVTFESEDIAGNANDVLASSRTFRAHQDASQSTDIARSRMQIILS